MNDFKSYVAAKMPEMVDDYLIESIESDEDNFSEDDALLRIYFRRRYRRRRRIRRSR